MTSDIEALQRIGADLRYLQNLDWGVPRPGHDEGTVRAHIVELERNLVSLAPKLSPIQVDRLRLLIHTHDTFKAQAVEGVPIEDPRSHASLAAAFLAEFSPAPDLLAMVQNHDVPFALWRQFKQRGQFNAGRLQHLLDAIADWDTFVAFLIIDGCTGSKSPEPVRWFLTLLAGHIPTRWKVEDLHDFGVT